MSQVGAWVFGCYEVFVGYSTAFWVNFLYFFSVWARKSIKYCFQTVATVWVPWPRVASEIGISMYLVCGILERMRGLMILSPVSGGLMKSSAELIQRAGATM